MYTSSQYSFRQKVVLAMVFLMSFQAGFPLPLSALTSGPTQPEFNEFEPVGTTQMVDLFSGDFTYNIPLFELPGPDGGYPFNLSYHSGISMDQEASWVGLGWSLNHGAITRTMRGFPDDFNGDKVRRKMDMKDNKTWQVGINGQIEFLGFGKKTEKSKTETQTPPPDPAPPANPEPKLSLGLGLKVMHNSYKGWGMGMSFAPSAGLLAHDGFSFNAGLSLGLSSFDGATLQPSLSMGNVKNKLGVFNTSLSVNSREGAQNLSLGYSASYTMNQNIKKKNEEGKKEIVATSKQGSLGASSVLHSFGKSAHSPQVTMPYRGTNFSGSLEGGLYSGTFIGLGGKVSLSLIKQTLQHKGTWRDSPAYGYFHLKDLEEGERALLDFNREKDGPILSNASNLANPISTPDIYSVTGQGTGGLYRAYRSNVGIFTDPYESSPSGGGRLGIEINGGAGFDIGADLGGNYSNSKTQKWKIANGNPLKNYQFSKTNNAANFEPYYFKAAGEKTAELESNYEPWGAEDAVRLKLGSHPDNADDYNIILHSQLRSDLDANGILEDANGNTQTIGSGTRPDRKPRANAIQAITNEELAGLNGMESLDEYQIEYYTPGADITTVKYDKEETSLTKLSRDVTDRPHHVAGITSVQANGMRYVYGLPVQNNKQEEIVFSVDQEDQSSGGCYPRILEGEKYAISSNGDEVNYNVSGTDKYLDHNVIPQYTHAYLLTGVLGADYIDLDDIPGPSDGDYGYWVKFSYIKTSDNYQWRTPFHGANYMPGKHSTASDDKASVLFGSREQYYLATAETKTHVAEFILVGRNDGKGAKVRHQKAVNDVDLTYQGASFKLDKINLYSKLERFPNETFNASAIPIKSIQFNSTQSICGKVKNSSNVDAKLRLNSVAFTYENNTRGMLSPYRFDYDEGNPDYNDMYYDRWGTYRNPIDDCDALNFPYTYQDETQATMDENASAWQLEQIHLPSGATIEVNYEADDYAYVQDRTAMQMFHIGGIGDDNVNTINTKSKQDGSDPLTDADLRVFFELENGDDDIDSYIEDIHGVKKDANGNFDFSESQVYFKILVDLNNSNSFEYVSGYAQIANDHTTSNRAYGVDGQGNGYIRLAPIPLGDESDPEEYHPFSVAAWQFLKLEFPSAIRPGVSISETIDENNIKDAVDALMESFGEIGKIFKKYYRYCSKHQFGDEITLDRSFIRLNTPDKKKYGGDSRVKQVTLIDYWDEEGDGEVFDDDGNLSEIPTYGQVYEYTTEDDYGNEISSGVAANEPSVGYEECALRYAKEWKYSATLKTDENLFYEYPINETYYPGASVGYSKVTVKSLATHLAQTGDHAADLPNGFGTTGITVNEFYTAKDFPVLVEETGLDKHIENNVFPVFPVYHESNENFTGTQGYAIILNDMHGKPHKVTHYGMDDQGNIINQKLSEVIYTYSTGEEQVYTAAGRTRKAQVLDNRVEVLRSDHSNQADAVIAPEFLGVDYEFFVDMRERESHATEGFFGANVDFTPIFLFGLGGVPNLSINNSKTRTAVTNKIIRKSGILVKTDAFDGQSHITTTNKVFDPMTGEPLLTTVNNSFDDPIYNYNIPARFAYERMGAAYENLGMKFRAILTADEDCGLFQMENFSDDAASLLVKGDECLVTGFWSAQTCVDLPGLCDDPLFTYVGFRDGKYLFENQHLNDNYYNAAVKLMITRSGNRNHLSAKSGSITALKDPTKERSSEIIGANVPRPTGVNTYESIQIDLYNRSIDQVLNASAVTYGDHWDVEREVVQDTFYTSSGGATCNCLYVLLETEEPITNFCNAMIHFDVDGVSETYSIDIDAPPNFCFELFPNTFGYCYEVDCTTGEIGTAVSITWGDEPPMCVSDVDYQYMIAPGQFPDSNCSGGGGAGGGTSNAVIKARSVYSIGEKGIWRPQRNYAYVTRRTPHSASAFTPDLENDGVYEAFNLFSWAPFFDQSDGAENWRKTNEITKYASNGEEVENRDIIGLYSTALYGYNDNLPIAVGANAAYPELAFDGFEEYPTGLLSGNNWKENGNFDFECEAESKTINLTYNIIGGYDRGNYVWIDKTFYTGMPKPKTAYLILKDKDGVEYEAAAPVDEIYGVDPTTIPLDLPFQEQITLLDLGARTECYLPSQTYTGQVILQWELDYDALTSCSVEVSDAHAHTGKQSLKVTASSYFVQQSLQLQTNQNYVFSAWVSVGDGVPRFTLDDGDLEVELEFGGFATSLKPSGEVINGWQRIEGVFSTGLNSSDLILSFTPSGNVTYFDDLRIYPEDGSAQTYVYDPQNYRLTAVLDNNNYATFYHYDAEGNLFLVKKETARGVKTIQETREYVKAN